MSDLRSKNAGERITAGIFVGPEDELNRLKAIVERNESSEMRLLRLVREGAECGSAERGKFKDDHNLQQSCLVGSGRYEQNAPVLMLVAK